MGCLDNNYYEYNADAVVDNGTCLSKIGDNACVLMEMI